MFRKVLILASTIQQVRNPINASGRAATGVSLAPMSCPGIAEPTREKKSLPAQCASAASCVATTLPSTPEDTWQRSGDAAELPASSIFFSNNNKQNPL